jgi:prevent-host-death family protein
MLEIQKVIPVTQAKKELLSIIKKMVEEDSTYTVTKNGVPVGVLMTPDRFEGLMETIEILADSSTLKALVDSEKDYRKGRVVGHKEVWSDA